MKQILIGVDFSARHLKAFLNCDERHSPSTVECCVCGRGLSDDISLTARRGNGGTFFFCSDHL